MEATREIQRPDADLRRPERRKATLADIQRSREIDCETPSGLFVTIRPINLERHALAGGLPKKLRELAMEGTTGINEVLQMTDDDEEVSDEKREVLNYLDSIVRDLFVEPDLPADFPMEDLMPADYRWAIMVAMGEEDRDGQGRRLWGREPLSRFATFRDEHGCDEDCAACRRTADLFSAVR